MPDHTALRPGAVFPEFSWPQLGGGVMNPAGGSGWRILMVYRGRHCGICKRYFNALNGMLGDFAARQFSVFAVSADTREKAQADLDEGGWKFPLAYGLSVDDMRLLGLFISEPRSAEETDRPFAEPGMFAINPAGLLQTIHVGNASSTRTELQILLAGLGVTVDKGYPIRGTMR